MTRVVIGLPLTMAIYIADTMIDAESDREVGLDNFVARLGPFRSRLACWLALTAGYIMAAITWPSGSPGALFAVSAVFSAAAVTIDRAGVPRGHWLAVMLAVITLGVAWLLALPTAA